MQFALPYANFAIGIEKHRRIERLLVAEIVVEEALVGGGPRGDAIDTRAVKAELAEFLPRRDQDIALGQRRIALPLWWLGFGRNAHRAGPYAAKVVYRHESLLAPFPCCISAPL
jgi:hypothetical protein